MPIPRVYLETTMFNYYFDEDRDAHADTVTFFEECAAEKLEPFTSYYAINELENAPIKKRDKMISLIKKYKITVLNASDEVDNLARRYVSESVLPHGSMSDASHIAVASVNALDMIISLNFHHIVREKTIKLTNAINVLLGYKTIEIHAPMEVINDEKTRYHFGRNSCDKTKN